MTRLSSKLVSRVWAIAQENRKGFTITIPDCQPVTKGWAIGHIDTQFSHGRKGLRKVIKHSLETTKIVGGWQWGGKVWFDTVIIVDDLDTALEIKFENKQLAIYQIETGRLM